MMHAVLLAVLMALAPPPSQSAAATDLDTLMRDVLDNRDANTRKLTAYEFHETEELVIRGQDGVAPVQSYTKEFVWRGRDGQLVRDARRVNGVAVDDSGRAWDLDADAAERGWGTDDFYDWDSFFNFQYEPGRYFFAGREVFEGREVMRIEYYPLHMFSRPDDESEIGRDLDQTMMVTLWVLEEERQIVAFTFENVGLQFLPFRWLVRVGAVDVSLVFDRSPDGAWLPRRIDLGARASMASSLLTIGLTRSFHDFVRVADGTAIATGDVAAGSAPREGNGAGIGEAVPPAAPDGGTVVGVQFHGNFSLPDGQLAGIAGIRLGDRLDASLSGAARDRLLASGLVTRAEVRVRRRTLSDNGDVELVIVVRERAGLGDHVQFLPLFEWSDEYGITVGGRVSFVELYGDTERLSFPLSIGGRDRAEVEFLDEFSDAPINRLGVNAGYRREVNPHFNEPEARVLAAASVARRFRLFEIGVDVGWADVDFLGEQQQQVSAGVSMLFDTRRERGLPRNATYIAAGWLPLQILDGEYRNRYNLDVRGYLGAFGRSTVAIGATIDTADGPLPAYEKYLLGGMATLRGFTPGEFIGDNRIIASAELRVPVWEPAPVVLLGINGFWDTGSVWDHGTDLGKTQFYNGVGGGVFLMATFVQLNLDVAYGLDEGWQFHIGSGLRY